MPTVEDSKQQPSPAPATNGTPPATDPASTALAPSAAPPAAAGVMTIVDDDPGGSTAVNSFSSATAFATAQRMAMSLSRSSLVPKDYQGNISNCLIAIELASRVKCSVFAVMQNLDIIHGRPSWRSQFLIATVNACGRFTPLRFRWQGTPGKPDWGCRAVAKDKADGEECLGALITIEIAKAENWYDRNGSKWKTFPEQMLMYRSAAFWTRVYAPELGLGMDTADEVEDIGEAPATLAPVPFSADPANEGRRMSLSPNVKRLDPDKHRPVDAEVVPTGAEAPAAATPKAEKKSDAPKGQQTLSAKPKSEAPAEDKGDEPKPGEMGDRVPSAEG